MPTLPLPVVLILCTGNSCRSHMAEGILRHAAGDFLDVRSAGSKPAGYVHPLAIKVMAEIGIDISGHHSKHMDEFLQPAAARLLVGALGTTRDLPRRVGDNAGNQGDADPSLTHSNECAYGNNQVVETVITVCGNADQACPVFPGQLNRHHWGFDDPAHAPGDEEEQLVVFRRVRDEIKRVFEAYADGRCDAAKSLTAQCANPRVIMGKETSEQ